MKQLQAGARAPEFELKTVGGSTRRLTGALASGPVVLAFFKSSCPTCQFTFPFIEKIHRDLGISAAKLWAISQDEDAETRMFVDQYGLTCDVLIDDYPYPVSSAYNLEYVPAIFIVGADGVIRFSDYGFTKASLNEVAAVLAGSNRLPPELFKPNDGLPASRPG